MPLKISRRDGEGITVPYAPIFDAIRVAWIVAASVFSEFFVRRSLTLECSTTSRERRPNFVPISPHRATLAGP